MAYLTAWAIAITAGILGSVVLVVMTRTMAASWIRNLLRTLPGVLLLLPAPVPGYPGNFAPAFIVLFFEGLFQREGSPLGALTILISGGAVAALLVVLISRRLKARERMAREFGDNADN